MGLAFIPMYIKYLGIEAYGLVGFFAAMHACLGMLDMGLTAALGREMARFTGGNYSSQAIRTLLRSVELVLCALMLTIVTIGTATSDLVARNWLQTRDLSPDVVSQALSTMYIVISLRFLEGLYKSCLVGLQMQISLNLVSSFTATLRWFGAVGVIAWISPTVTAFFLWQAVSSLVTIVVLATLTYQLIPTAALKPQFSWPALSQLGGFAAGMVGISVLTLFLTQADKLLLSRLLILSDYGYYMLSATVAGGLYALISPVAQAYYPRMCELLERKEPENLIVTFHTGAQLVSVIAGSAAIVVVVFSNELLLIWTRDASVVQVAGPLLSILAFGNLLNGILWIPYQAQLAHGWTGLTIRTNAVALFFVIPAILFFTPLYGPTGAAWVWVALNTGYALISVQFMFRLILQTEKWKWYLKDVLFPLAPTAVVVFILSKLIGSPSNFWAQLGSLFGVSCTAVLVAGLFADRLRPRMLWLVNTFFGFKKAHLP